MPSSSALKATAPTCRCRATASAPPRTAPSPSGSKPRHGARPIEHRLRRPARRATPGAGRQRRRPTTAAAPGAPRDELASSGAGNRRPCCATHERVDQRVVGGVAPRKRVEGHEGPEDRRRRDVDADLLEQHRRLDPTRARPRRPILGTAMPHQPCSTIAVPERRRSVAARPASTSLAPRRRRTCRSSRSAAASRSASWSAVELEVHDACTVPDARVSSWLPS